MPPGSARNASARLAIMALRWCMSSTMCSSVQVALANSRSTSALGMMPTTRPPAFRVAWATSPIRPPLPPPYTSCPWWWAIHCPTSLAARTNAGLVPGLEPQYTHTENTGGAEGTDASPLMSPLPSAPTGRQPMCLRTAAGSAAQRRCPCLWPVWTGCAIQARPGQWPTPGRC